jgi:hypothetical protein
MGWRDRRHRALPDGDTRERGRRADATSVASDAEKSFCDAGFRHFPDVIVVKSVPKF